MEGRPPPTSRQFTSEQLAPEQTQARQWHMWLRGERCGRPPDDEGMRGERRARCLRGVCVEGGLRVADTRVPGLGYWVCSPPFLRLCGSRRTKTPEGGGRQGGGTSFPSLPAKFRNLGSPIRLSCDVKACDATEQPSFSSLPSPPPPRRLRAELRANWDRCQSRSGPRGTPSRSALPNETTKQQICIYRNRCCNRFDSH